MGRHKKPVDEEKLVLLASLGLNIPECAAVLDSSHDSIERNFKELYLHGKDKCKASLRRKQYELAMAGNPTMLVWLGKNLLGQIDRLAHTDADGGPLKCILVQPDPKAERSRPELKPDFGEK